ncbi:DUF523 domain-containing protein [Exiguobacterium flavidum]|uniref:DUF523 domain-containing protein n=1 Tax=Exiguobacterium flavidum TaxID=2184695 RepID=UPI000DF7706B|nr:DUF523 domain-containing protein [Exiguobacterium flavidum]
MKRAFSSCLLGCECRYDGRGALAPDAQSLFTQGGGISICPEQMGGLSTPREPAEIVGGDGFDVLDGKARVMTRSGDDVTDAFLRGAQEALAILKSTGVTEVWLKQKSPSCGSLEIYDGSFSGEKRTGVGVTTALFSREGLTIHSA